MLVNDIPQLVRMLRFTMLSIPGSRYEFGFRFDNTTVDPPDSAGRSFPSSCYPFQHQKGPVL